MSYVALYRKYRPQTFDDVIGQDHIVNTLKNQIVGNKVSHAYLFTGTRGTGKTSTAKIFARAVNCPHSVENNGSPCGKCETCKQLLGVNMDVIEMDAASNNGVDYARDIREKVQYPPVVGKYKVYIIDEVHMLSVGAFNALLKTLEEPPKHALFVLCTTEVHKIPATILSRCMRFDFRLVPTATLANHVANIFDKENKPYTKEAAYAIAQAGEGSVRDCVSIADRCYSCTTGTLTYDDVMSVLGVSSKNSISKLCKAILTNNTSDILTETDTLVKEGKDVARLSKDLSLYIKDLLTVKVCKNANEMLALPDDAYFQLVELAKQVELPKLLFAIDTLVGLENGLRYALSPLMLFESAALKIGASTGEVDVEGLERRVTRLEQQPQNLTAESMVVVDKTNAQSVWRGVKVKLEQLGDPLLLGIWKDISVRFEGGNFVVSCGKGAHTLIELQYKMQLNKLIKAFCDKPVEYQLVERENSGDLDRRLQALGDTVRFENGSGKPV